MSRAPPLDGVGWERSMSGVCPPTLSSSGPLYRKTFLAIWTKLTTARASILLQACQASG